MIAYQRAVRFEEVDAAAIVFFGRFLGYVHEAMEHFCGGLAGGYAGLVVGRRVGLPAVHVDATYRAPVRYGDELRIETSLAKVGTRSAVFRYRLRRLGETCLVAEIRHTIVTTDLERLVSCDMPPDVRALFLAHLEPDPPGTP